MEEKALTIQWRKREYNIPLNKILYIIMKRNNAEIHVCGNRVYQARRTYVDIKQFLGDDFIEVKRGCMVSAMAIYRFKKSLELINGESIGYTIRRKKSLKEQLYEKRRRIINSFMEDNVLSTEEDYRRHYSSYEHLPFAFTDIEMVFNDKNQAVDWIFRYGNDELAKLEKLPLDHLIGSKFSALFPKMETKWLFNYERSAIYGETLEIIDYSPEIKTTLKIISFPTFKGHCGCILFDVSQIRLTNTDSKFAADYFGMSPENEDEE